MTQKSLRVLARKTLADAMKAGVPSGVDTDTELRLMQLKIDAAAQVLRLDPSKTEE